MLVITMLVITMLVITMLVITMLVITMLVITMLVITMLVITMLIITMLVITMLVITMLVITMLVITMLVITMLVIIMQAITMLVITNITWNPHIHNTSIKIARVIGILRKLKRIFPRHILRLIYNSLIHPHLLYGLNLWGFKHKRITVLQKKAVIIIAFRPYISHSTSAFKEMQILLLKDLYLIQLYKMYYKNVNNL